MTLEEKFKYFHAENPHVYELFKKFTFVAIKAGRKRLGVAMIFERMRWYTSVETNDGKYKLNNNHKSFYGRMFMADYPQYDGFFATRELRAV